MLEIKNLVKIYKTKGGQEVHALDDVSVKFPDKGMIFLLGKSGSGKSTLLNVTGGLDKPDKGEIIIKGKNSKDFSGSDFDSYRNTFIGFIFQEYNILNEFNVEQNIELALQLQGKKYSKETVNDILRQVDLEGFGRRKPNTLSGGQKQRIAIARALIKNPEIIMADEPTGALDSNTGKQVFDTLKKLSQEKLVIIVSHDRDFAEIYADRIIELADGKIISDVSKESLESKPVNDNINIINPNVLSIKDAKKLNKEDMDSIFKLLKEQDGEVIISSNERNLKSIRQAIHISDDNRSEVFNDTKDVNVKEYDGKNTKFIKSKLPFKRAFKIGASSIMSKPAKMILTTLLTVISLVMFGVTSCLMMYDKTYSLNQALENYSSDTEIIAKKYDYINVSHKFNLTTKEDDVEGKWESNDNAYFSNQEIQDLNSKNSHLEFAGIFNYGAWSNVLRFQNLNTRGQYYSSHGIIGLMDCGQDYLTRNNINFVAGSYPNNYDEIAISEYMYECFRNSNDKYQNYEDLIYSNEKDNTFAVFIDSNNRSTSANLKIVGIYSCGVIPAKYDEIKKDNPTLDSKSLQDLKNDYDNYLEESFHLIGVVSDNFYEHFYDILKPNVSGGSYLNSVYARGLSLYSLPIEHEVDYDSSGCSIYPSIMVEKMVDKHVAFFDLDGKTIDYVSPKNNEIYLSYDEYENLLKRKEERKYSYVEKLIYYYNFNSNLYELLNDNTQEAYNALNRLRNVLYSEQRYEGYDADVALVNTIYQEYDSMWKIMYVYEMLNRFSSQYCSEHLSPSTEDPVFAEYSNLHNQIMDALDNHNFEELGQLIEDADTFLKKDNRYLEHYFMKEKAQMLVNSQDRYNLSSNEYDFLANNYLWVSEYEISDETFASVKTIVLKYTTIDSYNSDKKDEEEISQKYYYKNYAGQEGEFKILGYFSGGYGIIADYDFICSLASIDNDVLYYYVMETSYVDHGETKYNKLITRTNFSQDDIKVLLYEGASYHYEMTNMIYQVLSNVIELIGTLKKVFLIIGIVTAVFAALMLFNFISSSINSKTREIGILRAVGARGSDLFKIFFSESGLVALICAVFATGISIAACILMNNSMSENLGIKILNFNILNISLIFGGALVLAVVGTFIPVFRASKRQPVDSIRTL